MGAVLCSLRRVCNQPLNFFHTPISHFCVFATDYYYQAYYNDDNLPSNETELTAQQSQYAEASTKDESQVDSDSHAGTDGTDCVKCGQEDPFISDSQVIKG